MRKSSGEKENIEIIVRRPYNEKSIITLRQSQVNRKTLPYLKYKRKEMEMIMGSIDEIKSAITHLPEKEFNSFVDWFEKFEEERWDKELEKDIAEGKLDNLADEALKEFDAGKCSEL
jgi:hypothetical protein